MDITNTVANSTILITGAVGVIIFFVRHLIITYFSTKNQIIVAQANDTVIERLEAEIRRLEDTIEKQAAKYSVEVHECYTKARQESARLSVQIDALEVKIDNLREKEVQDASDIMELSILISTHCKACNICDGSSRISELINRLKFRRNVNNANNAS